MAVAAIARKATEHGVNVGVLASSARGFYIPNQLLGSEIEFQLICVLHFVLRGNLRNNQSIGSVELKIQYTTGIMGRYDSEFKLYMQTQRDYQALVNCTNNILLNL